MDIRIAPHIDMKADDGTLVIGWLASQADMLAEDWQCPDLFLEIAAPGTSEALRHSEPHVMCRARDAYAIYCASAGGVNFQGNPCPAWDALPVAIRGHWYTVALRSLQLEALRVDPGHERRIAPNPYTLERVADKERAIDTWAAYAGANE